MAGGAPLLIIAAFYGASAVVLGAFGAHGLRSQLAGSALETWQTAVLYHLVHALALLGVGLWLRFDHALQALGLQAHGFPNPPLTVLQVAGWSFALGVLLFSGSLYALALGAPRVLGPVTPLGGVAFIVGWLAVLWAAVRSAV